MDNVIFNNPAVLSYIPYGVGVILALVGLFIVRLVLRSAIRRKVNSISDGPSMSMMDIDQMRKKGLVSDQEYRSIRQALAGSELNRERRRQQAEKDRLLLAEVERDPEAARLLLESEPESPPVHPAPPKPKPAPLAPAPATPHIQQPAAQAALRRVTQPVAPELAPQPGDPLAEAIPGDPLTHPVRPGAGAPPAQPRPAAPRPGTSRPSPAAPAPASNAPRPAPAAPASSPLGELELLLQKGAITPEEYRRLKSMVR